MQSAKVVKGGVEYCVWAPNHREVSVLVGERKTPLARFDEGLFKGVDPKGKSGDLYMFQLGAAGTFPDIASNFQPQGVHGPSEVIDHAAFPWPASERAWKRPEISELVIYECHIGTFTPEGSFAAAAARLRHLKELGATAIQLMPVADFAGGRNWGYDMVSLYAPSRAYGRPEDLKGFIAAAHAAGLAVILDVVYNHFGPDGNYIEAYAKNFFGGEGNIWGRGINFGDPHVRDFFLGNIAHWMENYHVDGFRLDATHAIIDESKPHILTEIANEVRARGGFTIAEDERNWSQLVDGVGIDAVWADDFHHVVKMLLKPEPFAHFKSYKGTTAELLDTVENGWLFRGKTYKQTGKPRGTECAQLAPEKFVYCISNHDQAGNRPLGERLNHLISRDAYFAASALLCLLPYTPMIFMGQEFAGTTPFCFFTDHAGELGKNVSKGRLKEFQHYGANFPEEVINAMPDPQCESTFLNSKLKWEDLQCPDGRECFEVYRKFLKFRREQLTPELRRRGAWRAELLDGALAIFYGERWLIFADLKGGAEVPPGWKIILAAGNGPRTLVLEKA